MHFLKRKRAGVTLIELLIDIAVISTVAVAVFALMVSNIKNASYSHLRFVAANLANQRIEEIRNLPYDQVATENGIIIPQGNIPDEEDIVFAGIPFTVFTVIQYYDDPYDGLIDLGTDTAPIDYKKTTVKAMAKDRPVVYSTVTTNIGSEAAETESNTGILRVTVVDELNNPIENAAVTIVNDHLPEPISGTGYTNTEGMLMIPLLPPDNQYVVSATKENFSIDTTISPDVCHNIPPSPEAAADPTIIVQQVTDITLQIRCLIDLEIDVRDTADLPLPNYPIRVRSTRRTCLDNPDTHNTDELATKYDEVKTSDTNGQILIPQIEKDHYYYEK